MPENIVKVNERLENPAMRELMEKHAAISVHNQDEYSAVLNQIANEFVNRARMVVPVRLSPPPIDDGNGGQKIAPNTNVSFVLLSNGKQDFLPVFTDSDEFAKWKKDEELPSTILMDFSGIATMLSGHGSTAGIVMNPFSNNLVMNRPMVLKWYEQKQIVEKGHANTIITQDTPAELFKLEPYPLQLANTLCDTARSLPEVNAIWLRGLRLNGDDGYLLIVDYTGDRGKIFPAFGESAKKFLGGYPLHIVTQTDRFGIEATENVTPIYTKE